MGTKCQMNWGRPEDPGKEARTCLLAVLGEGPSWARLPPRVPGGISRKAAGDFPPTSRRGRQPRRDLAGLARRWLRLADQAEGTRGWGNARDELEGASFQFYTRQKWHPRAASCSERAR